MASNGLAVPISPPRTPYTPTPWPSKSIVDAANDPEELKRTYRETINKDPEMAGKSFKELNFRQKTKFVKEEIKSNTYVAFVAVFAVTGALCFGIDQGLMSVILVMNQFQASYPAIADGAVGQGFHKGLVTALLELGAFFGAFLTPHISDHLGRRHAMRAGSFFFLAGAIIQTASFSYAVLVAGRFIGGIGIGLLSSTMSVYVAEISPPNLRGTLLDLNELFVVTGVVVAYWLCFGTRLLEGDKAFRIPFALQMVPGVILFAALTWLPESPRWLVMRGRYKEARQGLAKLRNRGQEHPGVLAEWVSMRAEIAVENHALRDRHVGLVKLDRNESIDRASQTLKDKVKLDLLAWIDTWKGTVWRRTLIAVLLGVFQQLVGINALIYYAPSMVEALGFSSTEQLVQAGIINVTQLIGCIISIPLMDSVGRKKLLIFGALGMTICMVIVSVLMRLFGSSWAQHATEAKLALAFLNIYMVIFGTTWGPVPWAMPSELFPSSLRARGAAWSVMGIWIFNFIIGLIVPPMLDAIGWGTFLFFGAFSATAGVWAIFCVPETKGLSLDQIDRLFDKDTTLGMDEERQRQTFVEDFADRVSMTPGCDVRTNSNLSSKARVEHRED